MQTNRTPLTVLLVDDDSGARRSLVELLAHAGYTVLEAATAADARRVAEQQEPALAVLDLVLPDGDGLSLLSELRACWPALPAIVVTAYVEPRSIVEAMRRGAVDYLAKPVDPEGFLSTCRGALANRAAPEQPTSPVPIHIIGDSPTAIRLRENVQRLARSRPAGVLVLGEEGAGKRWLAQVLHAASSRRAGPCLVYPCDGAYDPGVALFGTAGSTGAGLLRAAQGGSVVLDDVDRLPSDLQHRLMAWMEESARSAPLLVGLAEENAADSTFLAWLGRATVNVPPLRERPTDVAPLARHFLAEAGASRGRRFDGFSRPAEQELVAYTWPGNVRELRDTVYRLAAAASGGTIQPEQLQSVLTSGASQIWVPAGEPRPLREITEAYIDHVILYTGGNKTRAAKILGVARETLRTHMLARRVVS